MNYDVFTFGETMIRFSPPDHLRLVQARELVLAVGGSESNVAAGLAYLGKKTAWFSCLPNNPLGAWVAAQIRSQGVDVSHVKWMDDTRLGLFFLEPGSTPRATRVYYDRISSAASQMSPDDLPLEGLEASRWMHVCGITPAISESCCRTVSYALDFAQSKGIRTSFDVNYRALLWDHVTASKTLFPFCRDADVVFIALRDAVTLFAAPDQPAQAAQVLYREWGGKVIVSAGIDGIYSYDGQELFHQPAFSVHIVDRIGAGDAMVAGIICLLLEGADLPAALQFGAATAALKLTISGDQAVITRPEVESLIQDGGGSLYR